MLAFQTAVDGASFRTVALTGQHAPGTPDGVNFRTVPNVTLMGRYVMLNDAGQTAFIAVLSGSGVDAMNDTGIWSEGSGSLALVAREGSQQPDSPIGVNFADFVNFHLNFDNAGQTAFYQPFSIWSDRSGSLSRVPISALGSQPPLLNDPGQMAFLGDSASNGVWSDVSGGFAPVALPGDHAPGLPDDATFLPYNGGQRNITFNNAGQITFLTSAHGPTSGTAFGIWSDRSGDLELVVRFGDQAPGLPAGVNFSSVSVFDHTHSLAMNDAGQIALLSHLTGPGVNSTNNESVWSERTGSLALVAREGSQAPGMPDGTNFGDQFRYLVQNNAGQIAFTDVNARGVWSDVSGKLELIASGLPSNSSVGINNIAVNDAGQVAFRSGTNSIWATDRTGELHRIVGPGDELEIAPGDFRTASGVVLFEGGNYRGRRTSGLNNRGQIAFSTRFTDGTSGIFVSNRVAIPEPSTLVPAATAFGLCISQRRRTKRHGLFNIDH
jgi:hypothetical protein